MIIDGPRSTKRYNRVTCQCHDNILGLLFTISITNIGESNVTIYCFAGKAIWKWIWRIINTHAYVYIKLYQYYSNLQMHMQGVKQNLLRQCLTITAYWQTLMFSWQDFVLTVHRKKIIESPCYIIKCLCGNIRTIQLNQCNYTKPQA